MRNSSSPSGGIASSPSGFATALATFARNLVRAIPTVIGRPTRSRTSRRSRSAMSLACLRAGAYRDVEERLVDREPLDERRRVVEDSIDAFSPPRRRTCGAGPRSPGGTVRARVGRPSPWRHRAPSPVAGREHDPTPHDYGLATKLRVISPLHGSEERVEAGVQDRRRSTNTCSACAAVAMATEYGGSACPSELFFDLTVGGRLRRELVEGRGRGSRRLRLDPGGGGQRRGCDHSSLVLSSPSLEGRRATARSAEPPPRRRRNVRERERGC